MNKVSGSTTAKCCFFSVFFLLSIYCSFYLFYLFLSYFFVNIKIYLYCVGGSQQPVRNRSLEEGGRFFNGFVLVMKQLTSSGGVVFCL